MVSPVMAMRRTGGMYQPIQITLEFLDRIEGSEDSLLSK